MLIFLNQNRDVKDKTLLFQKQWMQGIESFTLKTSGSTGIPKEIQVSHQSMIRSAQLTGEFLGLMPGETALLCMPPDFIAGKMMLVRAFVLQLNLVIAKPASNPLIKVDETTTIDFAAMTPMQVQECLKNPKSMRKLMAIRNLIIGGAPVGQQLEHDLQQSPGAVFETYGMTETLTHIAMRKLNGSDKNEYFSALPGIVLRTDQRGCLVIIAPHLDSSEIITNDLVELVSPTQFRWLGRADNVINSGGIKIFPEQVESKLEKHIDHRFIIMGLPDEKLGEKVVLVIEDQPSHRPYKNQPLQNAENLTGIFATLLTPYEKPRDILFLEKFPESSSGKILRLEIMNMLRKAIL